MVVKIKDTGIGIPSDMLSNIFEMFTHSRWAAGADTERTRASA